MQVEGKGKKCVIKGTDCITFMKGEGDSADTVEFSFRIGTNKPKNKHEYTCDDDSVLHVRCDPEPTDQHVYKYRIIVEKK